MQSELLALKANNKIHEEKYKLLEAEKSRLDKRSQDQLREMTD
jgi:hypothetical protein